MDMLHWPALKKDFSKGQRFIEWYMIYILCRIQKYHSLCLVFKMCLNTLQQVVYNNNADSKVCGLYLSQLIVGTWCLVKHIMLYEYLTKVYHSTC